MASRGQSLDPQPLVFSRGKCQLLDCVLELLILLASVAVQSVFLQDPVLRGTLQVPVHRQRLRLRHVDAALRREGVQVVNDELDGE